MIDDHLYSPTLPESDPVNECFLCGTLLTPETRTKEHVYPRWLIRKIGLQRESLKSPFTGTKTPYSRIIVPACRSCNTVHLRVLESRVQRALVHNRIEDATLSWADMCVWAAKVLYGTVLYDFLQADARSRDILAAFLHRHDFALMRAALQSLVGRVHFIGDSGFPASHQRFDVKVPRNPTDRFGLTTNPFGGALAIRAEHIGLLVTFDGGYVSTYGRDFIDRYRDRALHPAQFEELAADWLYMSELRTGVFNVSQSVSDDGTTLLDYSEPLLQRALDQMGKFRAFEAYDPRRRAVWVSATTGCSFEQVYGGEESITWLHGRDDVEFVDMDIEGPRH